MGASRLTGAVVPGPMAKYEAAPSTDAIFTMEGAGYQFTEQVVMTSIPVIPFWAIANQLIVPLSSNQAPEFYAPSFALRDAIMGQEYAASLSSSVFDSDDDPMSISKLNGPLWLSIAPDGSLSGVPMIADVGINAFTVEVSDGSQFSQATLSIDVIDTTEPTPPPTEAPPPTNLITSQVAEDTYSRAPSPDQINGNKAKIELRTQATNVYSRFGYLKFYVAGITNVVTSVKLFLFSIDEADPIDVYSVDSSNWTESTLTWNNQPTAGAKLATAVPSVGQYASVDLTGYIESDGTYSLVLKETGNSYHSIGSREGGQGAYLEIRYLQETTPPTSSPTASPSKASTRSPSASPSKAPSESPTANPSKTPTGSPTANPSKAPSKSPINPTNSPSKVPTAGLGTCSNNPSVACSEDADCTCGRRLHNLRRTRLLQCSVTSCKKDRDCESCREYNCFSDACSYPYALWLRVTPANKPTSSSAMC